MPEDPQAPQTPSNEPVSSTPPVPQMPEAPAANPVPSTPEVPIFGATSDQAPAFSQPVVSTHQVMTGAHSRKLKKPLIVSGIAVVAAVLIGGGFVFGFYLPNTPENVYSAGLENTGKAVDTLVAYSKTQEKANYSSIVFDGTLKVASPDASFNFDTNGSIGDDGNATATMDLDLMGNKGSASIRSVHVKGNTSPDIYLKVNGVKSYLDSNGMSALDSLDGQWISIDHTLIDTYTNQLKDMSPGGVSPETAPTYAQVMDAEAKVQVVNRQYLFTTNSSTAVLANEKYLGQTKENGRTLDHYKVGYNKDHFEAYAKALASALNNSKLNDWSQKTNKQNLSEVMSFSQLESDSTGAKGDYTFDLWVDTGTKLVSKVTFADTDPTDKNGTFTVSQDYTGGNEYPFSLAVNDKDENGNPEQFTIDTSVDTKTNKASVSVDGTSKDDSGTTKISFSINATPSKQGITVTAPTGAKSVNDILSELGLGGLSSGLPDGSSSSDMPLFFQQ